MNKIKEYCCRNLSVVSALFYGELLDKDEIICVVDILTSRGLDNDYLIDILINRDDWCYDFKGNFSSFLKSENLCIANRDEALKNIIKFIFSEAISGNIDFMGGTGFIIEYVLEYERSGKRLGDYLNIENIVGVYYAIDDDDIVDEADIKDAITRGISYMKSYLEKSG
jgi:hypothetical protein